MPIGGLRLGKSMIIGNCVLPHGLRQAQPTREYTVTIIVSHLYLDSYSN